MSIVVITIPEPSKIKFINDLINANLPVSLIVLQKRKSTPIQEKIRYYLQNPIQLFALIRLYLQPELRKLLASIRSLQTEAESTIIKKNITLIEVEDINHSSIVNTIKNHRPKIIAVWGAGLITNEIINTAPHVINLHLGIAPKYKGAIANQFAIANVDYDNIGFTIHHINEKVDDGDIIYQQKATLKGSPVTTFQTLLLDAHKKYVTIIKKIHSNKTITTTPQYASQTKTITYLKQWTPSKRLALALFLKKWQTNKKPPEKKVF